MSYLFYKSKRENFSGIENWDVSREKNMEFMFSFVEFYKNNNYEIDISNWDVSKVRNMAGMFMGSKFNGDISKWDMSNVENKEDMFLLSEYEGHM